MYHGPWDTWGNVPVGDKDRLFERFKTIYQWDPEIDAIVRKIWSKANGRRLSDSLSTERERATEMARAAGLEVQDDLSPLVPYNPKWIKQEYWRHLVLEIWNKKKWKIISKANKKNRAEFTGGYHTTGSAGFVARREELEEIMGGPISSAYSFIDNDTKKGTRPSDGDGSSEPVFIDDRSSTFAENYMKFLIEKFGPDKNNHPLHDQECWERAAGGRKRGRVYGSGSSSDPCFVLTGTPSIASSSSSYAEHRFEELQRLSQTIREEMREEHERELKEIREQHERDSRAIREAAELVKEELRREMNEKIAEMLKNLPNFQQP